MMPLRPLPLPAFVFALCAVRASASPIASSPTQAIVRGHIELRDAWRGLVDRACAWLESAPPPVPDVSVLTQRPVAFDEPSDFGWRDDPIYHTQRYHSGADFAHDPGTAVVAAGDGIVVFAGWYGGYGQVVDIDHGGGVVTRYAHLRRIATKKDAAVAAGETIGQVGSTGRATGPHLHFEIRLDGRAVDPVMAMTVAEMMRADAMLGRLASFALVPELQASPASRPRRHSQVLW
jgi:murein DD-endopeptidase MepM/ murein hydrolase activator NlpD